MQLIGTALLLFLLSPELTVAADPSSEAPASLDLPMWAIVVVALVIGLLVLTLSYFLLRRYLAKRRTVNTIDQIEKHPTTTTTATSNLSTSTTTMDTIDKRATQVYKPAMIDQEKMATLPLPPPSTSLFSDKMELNSEDAMQLFERYMQTERTKGGLSTIDLDIPQQLVNTVQQKMGTIKSTLQQSLRRQKSKSRAAPLNHMFDSPTTAVANKNPPCPDAPRKSLSELSRHTSSSITPSTPTTTATLDVVTPDVPSPALVKTSTTSPHGYLDRKQSSSSIIDRHNTNITTTATTNTTTASALSPPLPSSQSIKSSTSGSASSEPSTSSVIPCPPATFTTNTSHDDADDFYSKTGTISDTAAIHAARRVIRSASRKSKTRSTLINEDAVLKMFNQPTDFSDLDGDAPSQHYRDRRRASTAVSGYTTVSGRSSTTAGAALAGGGTSTRYLTNDILVRRASTLGRSYQVSQQTKPSTGRLEGLFDNAPPTPSIKATTTTVNPANEKVEVTQMFELTRQQESRTLPNKDDQKESNKYAVPDDTLLHPSQQSRYLPSTTSDTTSMPSSSNNNNKKPITPSSNDTSGGKGVMQDRMDNFEGLSAHTDSTGHSRKSSNSVATMVRISQQQHSQTWSGRTQSKRASIPQNHHHQQGSDSNLMSPTIAEDDTPSASSSPQQPKTFYTMRSTRLKQRTGLPSWYNPDDAQFLPQDKTPAQRERDQYLKTLHGNPPKPS